MNKAIIFSSLILIVSILLVAVSSALASTFLDDLLKESQSAQSLAEYKKLEDTFNAHEAFLSLFLRDSALSEIEYAIQELIAFAEYGSDEAHVVKNRLCCLIDQQRRLSGLNVSSIF